MFRRFVLLIVVALWVAPIVVAFVLPTALGLVAVYVLGFAASVATVGVVQL